MLRRRGILTVRVTTWFPGCAWLHPENPGVTVRMLSFNKSRTLARGAEPIEPTPCDLGVLELRCTEHKGSNYCSKFSLATCSGECFGCNSTSAMTYKEDTTVAKTRLRSDFEDLNAGCDRECRTPNPPTIPQPVCQYAKSCLKAA
jgi:hypothetical protein